MILGIQSDISWKNRKGWAIANPFYKAGYKQVIANYEKDFEKANEKGGTKNELYFKRYKLGQGVLDSEAIWINSDNLKWVSNEKEADKILNNRNIEWAAGFDLSLQGSDATAWVLAGWVPLAEEESLLSEQKLYLIGNIYFGNISAKPELIQENIRQWHTQKYLVYQNTNVIKQTPILDDFKYFLDKYPHIKEDLTIVFDPAFSEPWVKELNEYSIELRAYTPREMTAAIRNMQRIAESKSLYILEEKNPAIIWQTNCGYVSEMSKNFCMLNRINPKNPRGLNVDYWSAALLALSELLKGRSRGEVLVL